MAILGVDNVRLGTQVFIDGAEVKDVFEVDTIFLTALAYKRDSDGNYITNPNKELAVERLKGQITLRFPDLT